MKMNDLGSDFSKSYLIYIEECLGTFYSKHPSGPHLPGLRPLADETLADDGH